MRGRTISLLIAAAVAVVAGCSGSDGEGDAVDTIDTELTERSEPDDVTSPSETDETEPTSTTVPDTDPATTTTTEPPPTTVIPTVPDTGVPGIDSTDVFCRSWSEFAGSFQSLALASAAASDPTTAARSEVAASDAIIEAVAGLDANLPPELESERDALVVELVGPMARRAERARSELVSAGLTDEQIAKLAELWLSALADAGVDDPDIDVVLPPDLVAPVEAATAALESGVPPIVADPSLINDAQIPATEAYLVANCPDQGTLAGNDVIDQP